MSLLNLLGIQDAFAEATTTVATVAPSAAVGHAPTPPGGSIMSLLPTLVIFALAFYFLLIRPQSKRAKDQRKLMESITKDDEVLTTGGIAGKVIRVADNYLIISVADNVEMTFQKASVATVLPKGTLKSI
jgi:preprotein translocase subunit YajC